MRLLIIEDNADIVANLYAYLEPLGYVIDTAANGYGGLALAAEHSYDVILLDLTLPGLGGLDVCCKIRTELHSATPILMLTARDTTEDKIAGLEAGADDYLVKPFSLAELDARLKALVRRARGDLQAPRPLMVGDLKFDPATFTASRAGKPLVLTRTGYTILKCLMTHAPSIVTRETLEAQVWGDNRPDSDALRTHIHALRTALDKPHDFPMLRTLQGIGYRLVTPNDVA